MSDDTTPAPQAGDSPRPAADASSPQEASSPATGAAGAQTDASANVPAVSRNDRPAPPAGTQAAPERANPSAAPQSRALVVVERPRAAGAAAAAPVMEAGATAQKGRSRWLAYAAAAVALLAGGAGAGFYAARPGTEAAATAQTAAVATRPDDDLRRLSAELQELRASVASLHDKTTRGAAGDDVKALKERVAGLSEGVERLKQTTDAKLSQVATQIDKVERQATAASAAAKTEPKAQAKVEAKAESKSEPRPEPKAEPKAEAKSAPKPAKPAPRPAQAKTVAEAKPAERAPDVNPRTRPANGWVLRDIYGGLALIEGRRGLVEVEPGQFVAGLGRIERIERRGPQWYVVTERGYIAGYGY